VTPLKRGPGACGQHSAPPPGNGDCQITRSDDGGLIRLTVNEIRRLHATFCRPAHPAAHYLRWSRWRRRHQARARHCHDQRRRSRLWQIAPARRAGLEIAPPWVNHAAMPVATVSTEPERHTLVMPGDCE
jgi:hypothetical protein